MEEPNIPAAAIVEYLLISWIPWLVGAAMGGGLGVLCAHGMRALWTASPALRHPLVLLPWRTLVMGLLMVAWSPYIVTLLGLGPLAGGVMVGISVCILATPFTASLLVENWYPCPLRVRLVGGARTLAVASCLIAAGVGQIGGGGLENTLWLGFALGEHTLLWQGVLVVLATALVLDLAMGLAQLFELRRAGDSGGSDTAEGIAA